MKYIVLKYDTVRFCNEHITKREVALKFVCSFFFLSVKLCLPKPVGVFVLLKNT